MNPLKSNRIYCVLDMPLDMIKHFLLATRQSKQDLFNFVIHVTPFALVCLSRVSKMSKIKQRQVIKGEVPLYSIAEEVSSEARHHRQSLITNLQEKIK